tara:strand:+ start:169 stop:369 length:201 start_codon:yes stop_codon:yes gene_type:complete
MNGLELKELRKDTNTTQLELAEYLGYQINGLPNRSMIARFENGHAKINTRVAMLCKLFFETKKSAV